MTPKASLALRPDTGTVNELEVTGTVKPLTIGAVMSGTGLLTATVTADD